MTDALYAGSYVLYGKFKNCFCISVTFIFSMGGKNTPHLIKGFVCNQKLSADNDSLMLLPGKDQISVFLIVFHYFGTLFMTNVAAPLCTIYFFHITEIIYNSNIFSCRYKISLLKPSTKALALSCKVSIRTDAQGFLSLQYMIRNEDGQICFVEYYCCPDEDITEAEL